MKSLVGFLLANLLIILLSPSPARASITPNPVSAAQVTDKSATSVTLSWVVPADNGAIISDYLVEYLASGADWVTFSHAPTIATTITVDALSPATSYKFRIAAVASDGTTGPTSLAKYRAIQTDAGEWHSCALMFDGSVQCWGDNGFGTLGDGTYLNSRFAGRLVLLPEKASSIAVQGASSCAIGALSGSVYCWGRGEVGQLGNGANSTSNTPVKVQGIQNAVEISVGDFQAGGHACAIDTSGNAFCWGANGSGELGDGTTNNRNTATLVSSTVRFKHVSAANMYTCLVSTTDDLYCNGYNREGQLGLGVTSVPVIVPTLVPGIPKVAKVAALDDHTCAITTAGQIYCWGANSNGQLGLGDTNPRNVPTLVPADWQAVDISGVGTNTCALVNPTKTMKCWGYGWRNRIASGDWNDRYVPTDTIPSRSYLSLGGGSESSCATASDGTPYCWGGETGNLGFIGDNGTGIVTPIEPYVATLNAPPPSVSGISPIGAPVGATIQISGSNLRWVSQVKFGDTVVPFSKNIDESLSALIPISLTVGVSYPVSVTSVGGASTSPSNLTVTQSPIVTINLVMTTDGQPLVGGSYTWLSQGRFSPSSPTPGTDTGLVTLTNVVSGPGQIFVTGGQLPDGRTVSGSWSVNLQAESLALDATPPAAPDLVTTSAVVQFPDGTPVPGAVLTASGLSGSYSDTSANFALTYYLPSAITQATSDVDGLAILYGYKTSVTMLGTATFDDTVLKQSSLPVTLTVNGLSTIQMTYLPYVATPTDSLNAVAGSTVVVPLTDTQNGVPIPGQTVTLVEESVTAPLSVMAVTAAASCPTSFTGTTDSFGRVSLSLCTAVAGLHTYRLTSVGAVKKYSTITMNVTTQAAATSFTLTGPSSGIVNTTSKVFTVTPDGNYTGTVNISVVGGGLNYTIPVTFSNSAVPQTFPITPVSTGVVTLTATSSPALINPSALTYTVNPAPATAYALTGPSSGAVNVASGSFSITPNGVYSGTITVTISGAGLNTTRSFTFANSSVAQSFTITPTIAGTVILSATNKPATGFSKLPDPTSLAYSVKLVGLTPTLTTSNANSTGFTVNVTNYNANYTFNAITTAGVVTKGTATGTTLPFTVTGLTAGQSATVTVTTTRTGYTNGQGSITASASGGSYVVNSATASPTGVSVPTGYASTATQTTVTLNRSGSTGSAPTASLTVNAGTWNLASTNTANLTSSTATVTTSSAATLTLRSVAGSFTLSLAAGSPAGTYTATLTAGTQLLTYTVSVVPAYTISSAVASPASALVTTSYTTTSTQTTVTLTRSGSAGSNPTATLSTTGTGTWTLTAGSNVSLSSASVASGAPVTVTLLGTSGTFIISLNTGAAVGNYTASLNSTTPFTYTVGVGNPPTAVQTLTCAKGTKKGTASCTWTAPSSPGTSQITRYEYRFKLTSATTWSTWTSTNLTLSLTLTGLTAGASYDVEVRAVNSYGVGASTPRTFTA